MTTGPLSGWRFRGTLRRSQRVVLDAVRVDPPHPLHLVAPPGSGKTLLGLLLAVRRGDRTLVLAPTTTVRDQWAATARDLAGARDAVGTGPGELGDLTALTYQLLAVVERGDALAPLALDRWRTELVAGGRSEADADAWLTRLAERNPAARAAGVASRTRLVRRELTRADPEELARVLHPNARALVDALVAHGVRTVILDECHHLLDHWALVVAYLTARIRAAGGVPLLIGLTATLPSPQDQREYENYTGLLGEVDHELPTPAVVKEGNLAPYRDLVRFVEPDAEELAFLAEHRRALVALIAATMGYPDGVDFLVGLLQPEDPSPDPAVRLTKALRDEPELAAAAAAMLPRIAPDHPLVAVIGDAAARPPDDAAVRLMARYALERILPVPARAPAWDLLKRTLVDFGYTLTDRGVRRGRDPVDTILATSRAKDGAVVDVLRWEAAREGERLRAVVVTDHASHGNKRGKVLAARAGAVRCFARLVAAPDLAALRPVLVTARTLRVARRDAAELGPAFEALLGVPIAAEELPDGTVALRAAGAGTGAVVAAVSTLLTEGTVRAVVSTRGLLGEGWDCPAVNTLVDLTTVAASAATQQLRGRTLRLDPSWPGKVAHNWAVAAVLPPDLDLDGGVETRRLLRKYAATWGLEAGIDAPAVVRGPRQALLEAQLENLDEAGAAALTRATLDAVPARERTRAQWRVGEPYEGVEGARVHVPGAGRELVARLRAPGYDRAVGSGGALFTALAAGAGATAVSGTLAAPASVGLGALALALAAAAFGPAREALANLRRGGRDAPARAAGAVVDVLAGLGRIGPGVRAGAAPGAGEPGELEVRGGTATDRLTAGVALEELFGPVLAGAGAPRFLLRVDRPGTGRTARLLARLGGGPRALAVPAQIGRTRAGAEAFAAAWRDAVGPAELVATDSEDGLALLEASRARPVPPARADQLWT